MDIKIVNIRKTKFADSICLAFIDLQYGNLVIEGFRIINGRNGRFISFPRQQGKDGKWYDTVKPVDIHIKQTIENFVLGEYDKYMSNSQESDNVHSEIN